MRKAEEKIKYKSFEKIKLTNKSKRDPELKKLFDAKNNLYITREKTKAWDEDLEAIEDKIGEKLLEKQRSVVERELEDLKDAKKRKTWSSLQTQIKSNW